MARGRFSSILQFLRPYRRQVVLLVAMTVVMSVLSMLPPLVTRSIVDRGITPLSNCRWHCARAHN